MSIAIMDVTEPFDLFAEWLQAAEQSEINDPSAVALATTAENGQPSVRMVLLRGYDTNGFIFYTNFGSQKGVELLANPRAALCFHWKSLRKQIRVEGMATPVDDAEADEYFASRPRNSQIGAWASKQSSTMTGRFELEKAVAKYAAKYAIGTVPRPDYWSGFRIVPTRIEFWDDRPYRLHDRQVYSSIPNTHGTEWKVEKLYP